MLGGACASAVRQTRDDPTVTTRVKNALINDTDVNALDINVTTENGVVTLSGHVKSPEDIERAVAVARQVPGVTAVNSVLEVESSGQ